MIFNIQALRAIAAYLVVLVHLKTLAAPLGGAPELLEIGAFGVDLFFVVSGFVMVRTAAARPSTPGGFFVNRLVRIVPMYWGITFVVFALSYLLSGLNAPPVPVIDLVKSLLFFPYARPDGRILPVVYVGWTLNYEMFFYLLFSLSLLLPGGGRRVAAVAAMLVVLVGAGLVADPQSVGGRFYTAPIILEFAFGMFVGYAYERDWRLPKRTAVAVLAAGSMVLVGHGLFLEGERALWSGIPAMGIVAAAVSLEHHEFRLRQRWLQLLGGASYVLYLIHPLALSAMDKAAVRLGLLGSSGGAVLAIVLGLAITTAVAVGVHLLLELPLNGRVRKLLHRPASVVEQQELRDLEQPPAPEGRTVELGNR